MSYSWYYPRSQSSGNGYSLKSDENFDGAGESQRKSTIDNIASNPTRFDPTMANAIEQANMRASAYYGDIAASAANRRYDREMNRSALERQYAKEDRNFAAENQQRAELAARNMQAGLAVQDKNQDTFTKNLDSINQDRDRQLQSRLAAMQQQTDLSRQQTDRSIANTNAIFSNRNQFGGYW